MIKYGSVNNNYWGHGSGSCFMSYQLSKCRCMRLISMEQLREGDIFKIALLYTKQEALIEGKGP